LAIGLGDRHIGWLGDLAEMAALLRGSLAWEQSIALAQADADADFDLGRTVPADALRWAAYTDLTPQQAEDEFLRPLWQLVSPPSSPPRERGGSADLPPVGRGGLGGGESDALFDRWQKARLYQAIETVTTALDTSDPRQATEEVSALVRDLSYWFAFERFDVNQMTLSLLAPFTPHLVEAIHRQAGSRFGESVHLVDWPMLDPSWADPAFLAAMVQVQRLSALGQAARAEAGIEPGRRLNKAQVNSLGGELPEWAAFEDVLADALTVARVEVAPEAVADKAAQVIWRLSLTSPQAGDDEVDTALGNLAPEATAALIQQSREGLSIGLDVRDQMVTLLPGEIRATPKAPPGWAAAADTDYLLLLSVD
jgi:isoleucyl-tRNA synthetase